jgi:ATP-dependent DNA ligase
LILFFTFELDGIDMRREPIETRKATLATIVRKSLPGVRLNEHIAHPKGAVVFHHACKLGADGIVSKAPRRRHVGFAA